MAEEIAYENGRISNFEGLVTLTLTLDRVILHTVLHHSSTSTYMQHFHWNWSNFVDGWTYVRTDGHLRLALLGQLCRGVDLKSKHASITKHTTTQNKHKNLKPCLVAAYDSGLKMEWACAKADTAIYASCCSHHDVGQGNVNKLQHLVISPIWH